MANTVHQRIKELIQTLGMSLTAFAESIGTSSARISYITSGRNDPNFDLINKILETYPDVNANWLVRGKGSMFEDQIESIQDSLIKEFNDEEKREIELALAELKGYLKRVFKGKENLYHRLEQQLPKSPASNHAFVSGAAA